MHCAVSIKSKTTDGSDNGERPLCSRTAEVDMENGKKEVTEMCFMGPE